jgi:hypothetical protein
LLGLEFIRPGFIESLLENQINYTIFAVKSGTNIFDKDRERER